ncbi:MAG: cell division protein FtsK [Candidatus Kerfeldbacteria bacterium CG15_BIG_FIL_POST_REV_8_21_14_020_45_12]|uniref:Cell division protein FtsK n=1 Tax=Candidatus Kerfeldbacteria bacterium CG15_BIG_FIL_POST_REV_8_21_14_020_45_12 TaxID=2014247 RepID=A0A2M7H367_9BACT|nr:MAG: cell division protein FtsK [Candidatus Kerfeldbacteria bacterium CG15_BIG_FIL_POST_REV_8_21_14_020_45_12]PJA93549.1 MAG: cell division protein FtsK [Candidatus Kerfeldbacteria bacterium CG_4_9_14_3_um_filter_45_8]
MARKTPATAAKQRGKSSGKQSTGKIASETPEKTSKRFSWDDQDGGPQQGLIVILLFALGAVSILSYVDAAGPLGQHVDQILGWIFGWGRYMIWLVFFGLGYALLHPEKYAMTKWNYIGLALFLLSGLGMLHLSVPFSDVLRAPSSGRGGGFLGVVLNYPLVRFTGVWATIIVLLALFVASFLIMFNMSLKEFLARMRWASAPSLGAAAWAKRHLHSRLNGYEVARDEDVDAEDGLYDETDTEEDDDETVEEPAFTKKEVDQLVEEVGGQDQNDLEQMELVPKKTRRRRPNIDIPMSLLSDRAEKPTSGDIEANKEKIRHTLASFGIEVEMSDVSVGPMVSQFTLKPADGVKLTQITTLNNDISLALAAHPIRIEAPIPGRSLVGIEVPNKATAVVTLKQVLTSKQFKKRENNLALALGKDVAGKAYITGLESMPHLLIAGATGSGKSVCINSVILNLMYQNSPDDLKMIMIDPKRVELSMYNGIPYLLTPVITDVEKTVNALKWTVAEMDRRYEVLSAAGKRNIDEYNTFVDDDDHMPYIVFIIDELADLMSVAASSVEAAIVRLAQMSRAVGIHLVLATQRPSVNVITGLIKANMPARIAFSVTSLVDSRTILDFSGAEKLIGRGDMLYIDSKHSKPKRLQGAYVSTEEIDAVVNFLKEQSDPDYNNDVTDQQSVSVPGFSGGDYSGDGDDLIPEAKEIIVSAGKASASLLQRRLRVGYARAARILDILEEEGFIGPADGAKPREVLATEVEVGEVPDDYIDDNEDGMYTGEVVKDDDGFSLNEKSRTDDQG